ncbi:hypothetical protein CGQ24_16665 [Arthrobacter sp. 7749]|nr:hypothetical protein CGQ24_16665 [Arthrobacter sp. 7749]
MNTPATTPPAQRILTLLAGAIATISLATLVIILFQYVMHVSPTPALLAVSLYGLPIAFILLMVILVLNCRQRRGSN